MPRIGMKVSISLMGLCLSTVALADQDRASIDYRGQALSRAVNLSHDVYRTEYHQVWVTKTCYRQETRYEHECSRPSQFDAPAPNAQIGDAQVIGGISNQQADGSLGHDGGGGGWHDGGPGRPPEPGQQPPGAPGGPICRDVSRVIDIPYDCSGYETQSYQVFDHTVSTEVDLDVASSPVGASASIDVDWSGSVSARSSALAFAETNHAVLRDTERDVRVQSKLVPVSKALLLAPVSTPISEYKADGAKVSFKIAKRIRPDLVQIALTVKSLKKILFVIADDKTIFNRALSAAEMKVTPVGSQELIEIDLAKLGASPIKGKRNRVEVNVTMQQGNIINSDLNLSSLKQKASTRVNL